MVKIKEGYVMNRFEQQWFERQNALPRKASGTVAYYFKRQTKYPPRIYVFMHAELWCDRNRRPMGLYSEFAFLNRPMNREEIEYHHFDTRLCYHQYEDWDKLLYAEQQEADELDREVPGGGTHFLDKLRSFRSKYPLTGSVLCSVEQSVDSDEAANVEALIDETNAVAGVEQGGAIEPALSAVELNIAEADVLNMLIEHGPRMELNVISITLEKERTGMKRKAVLIALTTLYRNFGVEEGKRVRLDMAKLLRKVEVSEARTRRNLVRRVYRKNKLFALAEIRTVYPDYTEELLLSDLRTSKPKIKPTKPKPVLDLRRCQLQKLASKLEHPLTTDKEYHDACCRIVMLQNAHAQRLPIPLAVKLQGETKVYSFAWQIRESVVKAFVSLANAKEMTHNLLAEKHREMCSSSYSY